MSIIPFDVAGLALAEQSLPGFEPQRLIHPLAHEHLVAHPPSLNVFLDDVSLGFVNKIRRCAEFVVVPQRTH